MIAGQFIYYGREYEQLCRLIGETEEADQAKMHIENMEKAVIKDGWDGEWYLRAYDHFSRPIGSSKM